MALLKLPLPAFLRYSIHHYLEVAPGRHLLPVMRRSSSEPSTSRNDSGEDVRLLVSHVNDEEEEFGISEGSRVTDVYPSEC